ncbi:putative ATP-dependent RNA helicase TDRD12 isoform X2 [Brachyhypopomus gauderio]|uniref:putative ATP-dependent RNA helicase TDRD12 isoform X2 n=1 Tax=Brachyhypopomus gauderio TaxID=698409 RepID=UPI00404225FD
MLEISIIKVEDPGCLWGRVLKGPGVQGDSPEQYDDLHVKMNLFYHEVDLDVQKVKPTTLEEEQVCVVFCPAMKSWCRATVETLFLGSVRSRAICFLVDYGERIIVSTDDVRAPLEKFLQLPFRLQKFRLARIHPLTLKVSICDETAQLVPSPHWDSSATKYLCNLLQASSLAEAVLCETNANCTAIDLYLTIKNFKICVNDDLVMKKFASFSSEKATVGGEQTDSGDHCPERSPVCLDWDIYSNPDKILKMKGYSTVRPPSSFFLIKNGGHDKFLPRSVKLDTERANGTSLNKPHKSLKTLGPDGSSLDNGEIFNGPETCGAPDAAGSNGFVKSKLKTCILKRSEDTESSLAEQMFQELSMVSHRYCHTPYRLMKFLKPSSHSNLIPKPDEDEQQSEKVSDEMSEKLNDLTLVPHHEEEETALCPGIQRSVDSNEMNGFNVSSTSDTHDTTTELKEPAFCQEPSTTHQLACARLLQLLNPDPLNPDVECLGDGVVGWQRTSSGVLVHTEVPVSPCRSLNRAPITAPFRKFLLKRKYNGPSLAESYFWPPVARGCDALLVRPAGGDHLSYLPALLAQIQLSTVYSTFTTHAGPVAVVLCPGWEKVQCVLELLDQIYPAGTLHPAAVILGLGKDEAKQAKIHNKCQLLVTTPFSLARLLDVHCFLFLRLCHLVLDEVDELYSRAPEQMAAILKHFKNVVSGEGRGACPRQIVAVAGHWVSALENLVQEHMVNPCIIITVPEDAALYGGVHQMILLCLDCSKTSVLLSSLDLSPSVPQKTLIITNSVEEVEHVYKAVSSSAAFCLKVHEGLTYQFDFVVEQWKKDIGPGTQVILVTTNDCLKALCIRDATCVVHYGFPSSPKVFGNRLFCMSHNFRNLSKMYQKGDEGPPPAVRSLLLLSEQCAPHVCGVLRFLRRAGAALPAELLRFAQGVQQAREERKTDRALCGHLKSLGFCRDSTVCPDRHTINQTLDCPLHPESGTILVLPLYIKSANVYFGRIVNQKEDPFETLAAKMCSHYAIQRLFATDVEETGLYAVQEEDVYYRVRVTKVPEREGKLFSSVTAHFVDEGRTQDVKSHQLLVLPPEFQLLPPQAVEIILCRAQPIDGEMDWHPKVTRAISLKIKGKVHQAKVVMCLGNTVWVDPMIRMTRLPGLKAFINEYNVHTEVLATGMGTNNPQHVELLRALCLGEQVSATEQPSNGSDEANLTI